MVKQSTDQSTTSPQNSKSFCFCSAATFFYSQRSGLLYGWACPTSMTALVGSLRGALNGSRWILRMHILKIAIEDINWRLLRSDILFLNIWPEDHGRVTSQFRKIHLFMFLDRTEKSVLSFRYVVSFSTKNIRNFWRPKTLECWRNEADAISIQKIYKMIEDDLRKRGFAACPSNGWDILDHKIHHIWWVSLWKSDDLFFDQNPWSINRKCSNIENVLCATKFGVWDSWETSQNCRTWSNICRL